MDGFVCIGLFVLLLVIASAMTNRDMRRYDAAKNKEEIPQSTGRSQPIRTGPARMDWYVKWIAPRNRSEAESNAFANNLATTWGCVIPTIVIILAVVWG